MTYEPVTLEHLMAHELWAKRIARRLVHGEAEADDLVQRTWLAAMRSPPSGERGMRAWIRRVILNLARERHRGETVRLHHERASFRGAAQEADTLEVLAKEEVLEGLCQRLLELDEPYRSVVIERYYDGLSSVEIARRRGIPTGTVRWRLKVGLDQLRAKFDRGHGGDRSRWVSALLAYLVPDATGPIVEEAPGPGSWALSPSLLGGLVAAGVLTFVLVRGLGSGSDAAEVMTASFSGAPSASSRVDAAQAPRATGREALDPFSREPATSPSLDADSRGLRLLVVDEHGSPVPDAEILVARRSGFESEGRTDSEGLAWFQPKPGDVGGFGVPASRGRVTLRVLAEGREASDLLHAAPPFTSEHEVVIPVGGAEVVLEGTVVDTRGAGVPGASVTWYEQRRRIESVPEGDFTSPGHLSTRCDAEGRFRLAHLPLRMIGLACSAPGFPLTSKSVDTRKVDAPITLSLSEGASVGGVVRWPDGRPAANVELLCEPIIRAVEWAAGLPGYDLESRGFAEKTLSDEDGRYLLEDVGTLYRRTLWARDRETGLATHVELELQPGERRHWEAQLGEPSGFLLKLEDQAGRPMSGWCVFVRRPLDGDRWWIRRAAADEEGRLRIRDCPNQPAFLEVFDPTETGAAYVARTLQPGPEEQIVVVDTDAVAQVSGSVADPSGKPESRGRLVFYSRRTGLGTRVERDQRGEFIQRLAPGLYVLALELQRTATDLGLLDVRGGERHWMGTMTTPEMGELVLNWAALDNGNAREPHFELAVLSEDGTRALLDLGPGLFSSEDRFSMFPGRYRLLTYDGAGSAVREHVVTIRPNAEVRLDLEP